jgi:hypothetical protein
MPFRVDRSTSELLSMTGPFRLHFYNRQPTYGVNQRMFKRNVLCEIHVRAQWSALFLAICIL